MYSKQIILSTDPAELTGITNFMRRIVSAFICCNELEKILPEKGVDLLVIGSYTFSEDEISRFLDWVKDNGQTKILFVNYSNILARVFEEDIQIIKYVTTFSPFAVKKEGDSRLVSLPGYEILSVRAGKEVEKHFQLYSVHGYFSLKNLSEMIEVSESYFLYRMGNLYLAGLPVFRFLGDLFLGKKWLNEYINWYNPLLWIDDYIMELKKIFESVMHISFSRNIGGLFSPEKRGIISIRHDLDSSRDTVYLDYEKQNSISASYSVLLDKNTAFWLSRLDDKQFEIQFHYSSIKPRSIFQRIYAKIFGEKGPNKREPWVKGLSEKGIYKQYVKAEKRGIYASTLTRHEAFVYLPGLYRSMDYLCHRKNRVIGSGSLFRGVVLKEKSGRADGISGNVCKYPETIMPYWFPVKVILGEGDKVYPVSFWESAHVMERDNATIDIMLEREYSVFVFGFHPYHAERPTFSENGNFKYFKYLVARGKELDYEFLTLRDIYKRFNEWEEENAQYYFD